MPKPSQFSTTTTPTGDEWVIIVKNGTTSKTKLSTIKQWALEKYPASSAPITAPENGQANFAATAPYIRKIYPNAKTGTTYGSVYAYVMNLPGNGWTPAAGQSVGVKIDWNKDINVDWDSQNGILRNGQMAVTWGRFSPHFTDNSLDKPYYTNVGGTPVYSSIVGNQYEDGVRYEKPKFGDAYPVAVPYGKFQITAPYEFPTFQSSGNIYTGRVSYEANGKLSIVPFWNYEDQCPAIVLIGEHRPFFGNTWSIPYYQNSHFFGNVGNLTWAGRPVTIHPGVNDPMFPHTDLGITLRNPGTSAG